MPRRGDSSASSSDNDSPWNSDRSPSPIRDRNRSAQRNDGYQSGPTDQMQESDRSRYRKLLERRDNINNSYSNFEERLNMAIVQDNPCGYTQREHTWLQNYCSQMHEIEKLSISKRIDALRSTEQTERQSLWNEGRTLTIQKHNMWNTEIHQNTRNKFNTYKEWIEG